MFYSHFHLESPSDNSINSMGHVMEGKNTWHERNLVNVFIHKWDLAAMAEQSPETRTPLSNKPQFTISWSSSTWAWLGGVAQQLHVRLVRSKLWSPKGEQDSFQPGNWLYLPESQNTFQHNGFFSQISEIKSTGFITHVGVYTVPVITHLNG